MVWMLGSAPTPQETVTTTCYVVNITREAPSATPSPPRLCGVITTAVTRRTTTLMCMMILGEQMRRSRAWSQQSRTVRQQDSTPALILYMVVIYLDCSVARSVYGSGTGVIVTLSTSAMLATPSFSQMTPSYAKITYSGEIKIVMTMV